MHERHHISVQRCSGKGRPSVVPRRTQLRQPESVKDLAHALPANAYHTVSWREGTNATLSGRFAAVRVRHAGGHFGKARLHPEQRLLIEWPIDDAEPLKYYLSKLPEDTALNDLVAQAHMRWRIERDYKDLKQKLGLGHYEGRGWRGFHHHAMLCMASYGFLIAERIAAGKAGGTKKTSLHAKCLPFPRITSLAAAQRAQRHGSDSINTIRYQLSFRLIANLGQCPCCGRRSGSRFL